MPLIYLFFYVCYVQLGYMVLYKITKLLEVVGGTPSP